MITKKRHFPLICVFITSKYSLFFRLNGNNENENENDNESFVTIEEKYVFPIFKIIIN